jgi:hypothetical protein
MGTIRAGQHVRVTLLRDNVTTDDRDTQRLAERTRREEGAAFIPTAHASATNTVYEGSATDVDADGFFDLHTPDGATCGFYVADSGIHIEVLT